MEKKLKNVDFSIKANTAIFDPKIKQKKIKGKNLEMSKN